MYGVLGDNKDVVGVAFFVTPRYALTVCHNIFGCKTGTSVTLQNSENHSVATRVTHCDRTHDLAVLEPQDSGFRSEFLVTEQIGRNVAIEEFTLVTFGLSLEHLEGGVEFDPGVVYHVASILKTTAHHISYESSSFDGDSSGALVLRKNGHVVGMHISTVNRARELKRMKEVDDRLGDIEESVDTLIKSTANACLALRMDVFATVWPDG